MQSDSNPRPVDRPGLRGQAIVLAAAVLTVSLAFVFPGRSGLAEGVVLLLALPAAAAALLIPAGPGGAGPRERTGDGPGALPPAAVLFILNLVLAQLCALVLLLPLLDRTAVRLLLLTVSGAVTSGLLALADRVLSRRGGCGLLGCLLAVPWLSAAIALMRATCFFAVTLHILGMVGIETVELFFMLVLVVGGDLLDGRLVRRYAPAWRTVFRIMDSAVDKAGVTAVAVALVVQGELSLLLLTVVLTRDALVAAGYLALLGRGAAGGVDSSPAGKAHYIALAAVEFLAIAGVPLDDTVAVALLALTGAVSLIGYGTVLRAGLSAAGTAAGR